jgi:hypothetical protein
MDLFAKYFGKLKEEESSKSARFRDALDRLHEICDSQRLDGALFDAASSAFAWDASKGQIWRGSMEIGGEPIPPGRMQLVPYSDLSISARREKSFSKSLRKIADEIDGANQSLGWLRVLDSVMESVGIEEMSQDRTLSSFERLPHTLRDYANLFDAVKDAQAERPARSEIEEHREALDRVLVLLESGSSQSRRRRSYIEDLAEVLETLYQRRLSDINGQRISAARSKRQLREFRFSPDALKKYRDRLLTSPKRLASLLR